MNWHLIAADALAEFNCPDTAVKMLADQLEQTANNFIEDELPQMQQDAHDAAEAMHWHRKIDEARGK